MSLDAYRIPPEPQPPLENPRYRLPHPRNRLQLVSWYRVLSLLSLEPQTLTALAAKWGDEKSAKSTGHVRTVLRTLMGWNLVALEPTGRAGWGNRTGEGYVLTGKGEEALNEWFEVLGRGA